MMETTKSKLTRKKKLGYAFGIACESILYNMYYTYFLTFLVQILNVKPYLAGIVIFISIGWDAVTDSVIGYLSDRPGVDKRKLLMKSVLPLCICFVLAWSPLGNLFGDSQALKIIFYTAVSVPVVTKVCEKTDRRTACLIFISVSAVGMLAVKLVGLEATVGGFHLMLALMPFLLGLGLSTFWTVFYSMAYDIVELDEFANGKNGERRESAITGFPKFVQKFGSATGILLQGVILSAYGYNATAESGADAATFKRVEDAFVRNGMENVSTLIPAAIITVALVFLILYPMTCKTYNALTTELKNKREGKKYGTDGLEKLL